MDPMQLIMLALQVAIIGTVLAFGLKATRQDVLYLLRRPGLLVRSVLAMFVVMPILVVLLVKVFDFRLTVEVVLVALAVSPVPPLLPGREEKAAGHPSYGLGLMLVLALVAIVGMPLVAMVLAQVFERPLSIGPGAIARIVVVMIVLPFVVGMVVRAVWPAVAARLVKVVRAVANVLLLLAVLALLVGAWRAIWGATGDGTLMAIAAFVLVGLVVGHVLGGPDPEHSAVLALSTACRHPAIALAFATANYPDERFAGTILLYLIVNAILGIPYIAWMRRRSAAAAST
jgi:BASS family bile acid:Na+ symporter